MHTLTSIIQDPEMGAAPFTILRRHMVLTSGEPVVASTETIESFGVVQPTKDSDLVLVPEEYRADPLWTFYSPVPLSLGTRQSASAYTAPDLIRYDSRTFLAISVKDLMSFGFSRAIAVEQKDPEVFP